MPTCLLCHLFENTWITRNKPKNAKHEKAANEAEGAVTVLSSYFFSLRTRALLDLVTTGF